MVDMGHYHRRVMTDWPELVPMKNKLVNYGVTENGIAIIELISDSEGAPLKEGKTPVNTYTRETVSYTHLTLPTTIEV